MASKNPSHDAITLDGQVFGNFEAAVEFIKKTRPYCANAEHYVKSVMKRQAQPKKERVFNPPRLRPEVDRV